MSEIEKRQQMARAIGDRCAAEDAKLHILAIRTNMCWPSYAIDIVRRDGARLILGVMTGEIPLEHESLDPYRSWIRPIE